MNLRISEFCSLARNKKWQEWLLNYNKVLYDDLMNTLTNVKGGCKKNTAKMIEIRNTIKKDGNDEVLFQFLKTNFPTVLDRSVVRKRSKNTNPDKDISGPTNKHSVFKSYNPGLLTFPQKKIIADSNPASLQKRVRKFIANKVKADFIIIEDRAYIEYFLPRFKKEAEEFPEEMREIYLWRKQKH